MIFISRLVGTNKYLCLSFENQWSCTHEYVCPRWYTEQLCLAHMNTFVPDGPQNSYALHTWIRLSQMVHRTVMPYTPEYVCLVSVTRAISWFDLLPGHPLLSLNMLFVNPRDRWKTPHFCQNSHDQGTPRVWCLASLEWGSIPSTAYGILDLKGSSRLNLSWYRSPVQFPGWTINCLILSQ